MMSNGIVLMGCGRSVMRNLTRNYSKLNSGSSSILYNVNSNINNINNNNNNKGISIIISPIFNNAINTTTSSRYLLSKSMINSRDSLLQIRNYTTENKPSQQQQQKDTKPEETNNNDQKEIVMPPNLSLTEKIKFMIKNYGTLALVVHFGLYLITLGSFYVAISNGVDVQALFERFGFEKTKMGENLGVFAVAFACTKITGLVRIPITVITVPMLARYLRRLRK